MRGNFVWHELMTTDTQGASSFYPRITGWRARPWEHDSSYTLFEGPKGPIAGLMKLPDDAKSMGAPPSWLVYMGTQDIAATIAQAQRLGGRVLKDVKEAPEVGKWAILADPQGATFAVLQSSNPAQAGSGRPSAGEFSWHELATSDYRAAMEFYGELFGWRKGAGHDMGPMGIYQIFSVGGHDSGGMFNKAPDMPAHWLSYIHVNDADAAARGASSGGGRIVNGPMDVPGGDRIAQIRDPQGGAFAVHSYPKAAARPAAAAKPAQAPAATQSRATSETKPAAASASATASSAAAPRKATRPARRKAAARKPAASTKRAAARKRPARKAARKRPARKAARKSKAKRAPRSAGRRASGRRSAARAGGRARASVRRRPRRAK